MAHNRVLGLTAAILREIVEEFVQGMWIGLYRLDGNVFGWTDNSRTDYEDWKPNEPSSGDCVEISMQPSPTAWDAQPCSNERGYICQFVKGVLAKST
jgi:hypothetical protein